MAKSEQNFIMFQGATKTIGVTITDDADVPVDLTGHKVKWALARVVEGPTLIAKSSTEGTTAVEITGSTLGEVDIKLSSTDTSGMYGVFYHEVEITDSGGNITNVLRGHATIRRALL